MSATAPSSTTSTKDDPERSSVAEAKQDKAEERLAGDNVPGFRELERENQDIFEKSVSNLSGFAVPLGSSRW